MPVECYEDFRKHGYIRSPVKSECLPLDARKEDKDVKYYRHETDPSRLILPYFADPTHELRYFVRGYTGHVPTLKVNQYMNYIFQVDSTGLEKTLVLFD